MPVPRLILLAMETHQARLGSARYGNPRSGTKKADASLRPPPSEIRTILTLPRPSTEKRNQPDKTLNQHVSELAGARSGPGLVDQGLGLDPKGPARAGPSWEKPGSVLGLVDQGFGLDPKGPA
jgi:hypothetical protein